MQTIWQEIVRKIYWRRFNVMGQNVIKQLDLGILNETLTTALIYWVFDT